MYISLFLQNIYICFCQETVALVEYFLKFDCTVQYVQGVGDVHR